MSHWAQIDINNKVIRVLVGDNNDPNGDEGYQWLLNNLGGTWIQTSYNNNIRKQYAGIGYSYNPVADVFIAPQPFASWSLDDNFDWQPPTPMPTEGRWNWDEATLSWVEAELLAE
jgi:hypothetical protein